MRMKGRNTMRKGLKVLCLFLLLSASGLILAAQLALIHPASPRVTHTDTVPLNVLGYFGWDAPLTRATGWGPESVVVADANNDGFNDLVILNANAATMSIYLWNASAGDWDSPLTHATGAAPMLVVVGDANADGFNDLVAANYLADSMTIYLWNASAGTWDSPLTRATGAGPFSVAVGDANADGFNDLATANRDANTVSIHLWNASAGTWDSPLTRATGTSPQSVAVADANNDGFNDLVTLNGVNTVSIHLWNATAGTWDAPLTRATGASPQSIAVADANNDGFNDLVTANFLANTTTIYLWNATAGTWDNPLTRVTGAGPVSVVVADANNDGFNDLVTANRDADTMTIYLWYETAGDWDSPGTWDNPLTRATGVGPSSVAVADADNDGFNDLVTANFFADTMTIELWHANRPLLYQTIQYVHDTCLITLSWHLIGEATHYYLFRDSTNITAVEGLAPMAVIGHTYFTDFHTADNTYYYAIIASNGWANSSLSNCERVIVTIPPIATTEENDILLSLSILIGSIAIAAAIVTHGILHRSQPGDAPPPPKKKIISKPKEAQ